MSIKTVRKIVIEDKEFRWRATWKYTGKYNNDKIIMLRAWQMLDGGKGSVLCVNLTGGSYYIVPREVAILIKYALANGWKSNTHDAPFWLKSSDKPELDNHYLVLTDELVPQKL